MKYLIYIVLPFMLLGCAHKYLCTYKDSEQVYATAEVPAISEAEAEEKMQYAVDDAFVKAKARIPKEARIFCTGGTYE